MKMEVIVLSVNHYSMDSNEGLNIRILNEELEHTNNGFGLDVTESKIVTGLQELSYLERFADKLPAKFLAKPQMTKKKDKNGKEITALGFKELEFVNSIEFIDKKITVKS